jgi:phage baseplate assembly protein W
MKFSNSKDLSNDFLLNPLTGDVSIKKGEDAIKQSLKNLLLMQKFDKPFDPQLDVGIQELLFEQLPLDVFTQLLREKINYIIKEYEPRVILQKVEMQELPDQNKVLIDITYSVKNTSFEQPQNLQLFLESVR